MVRKFLWGSSPLLSKLEAFKAPELRLALLKFGVIVFAVVAVYFQDLGLVCADALQYEGYSYVLLIPVLITYLLYRKRHMLVAAVLHEDKTQESTRYLPTLAGFLLCLTAFTVYIFGSQTFSPLQYHLISLPIFAAGLTLILFNIIALRQAIFPLVFLIFLTPPPVVFLNNVGSLLSVGSTGAANAIANFLGVQSWISIESGTPAINLIRPDNQPLLLVVDVACSGIYSLVGFVVFASFLAYIVRDKIWKKFVIILIGFPLIYFLNIIRITTIVLIGYQWGAELALEIFHILGGWVLVFLGTFLLLVIAEKIFKTQIFTKANVNSPKNSIQHLNTKLPSSLMNRLKKPNKNVKAYSIVKIVAVILVTLLVVAFQSPVFGLTRGPAPLTIQTASGEQGNVALFPQIEDYRLRFLYRDTDFEELSGQDFSLAFAYYPEEQDDIKVNVALEVAESTIVLHMWEVCLITWAIPKGDQPVTALDLRDVRIQEDPPIIARYFAFQEQGQTQIQLVLYYFTTALFEIDNTTQRKQVKLSFITYFDDPEDLAMIEIKLLPFAETAVNYWEPLRKWNIVTTAISKSSLPLATVTSAILVALVPFSWIQKKRRFRANASIYQKLHPDKQQILDAVRETEQKTLATLENIAETYQKTITHKVNKEELLKDLSELQELGLVKNRIISEQDKPVYTWKTEFTSRPYFDSKTLGERLYRITRRF
jgi:exosortase